MARRAVIIIVASVFSLIGAGVWAQNRPVPPILGPAAPPHPMYQHLTIPPEVLSGENLGVRVAGALEQDGKIKGTLVVKINGEWVDVLPVTGSAGK
jgi:hypothetical protein